MLRYFLLSACISFSTLALSTDQDAKIEHTQEAKAYEEHEILVKDVSGINITLATTTQVDGYNSYDIYGEFLHIQHVSSWRRYEPYIGDLDVEHTQMGMINPPKPYMETLERTFYFKANDQGIVGLSLLIPSKFIIKNIESVMVSPPQ